MSNLDAVIGIFSDDTEKAAEFLQRYEKEHDQLGITEAVAIVNEHEKKPNVTYMGISKTITSEQFDKASLISPSSGIAES